MGEALNTGKSELKNW